MNMREFTNNKKNDNRMIEYFWHKIKHKKQNHNMKRRINIRQKLTNKSFGNTNQ
jgi:hypothetical protein